MCGGDSTYLDFSDRKIFGGLEGSLFCARIAQSTRPTKRLPLRPSKVILGFSREMMMLHKYYVHT
jgi:hypothetical protein